MVKRRLVIVLVVVVVLLVIGVLGALIFKPKPCSGNSTITRKTQSCGYLTTSTDGTLDYYLGYITDINKSGNEFILTVNLGKTGVVDFSTFKTNLDISDREMKMTSYTSEQILGLRMIILREPVTISVPAGKNYLKTYDKYRTQSLLGQADHTQAINQVGSLLTKCDYTYTNLRNGKLNRLFTGDCRPLINGIFRN